MLDGMKIQHLLTALIIGLLILSQSVAETVYKKVNPDGSVEFTDQEVKGSKEIKVRDPITYTSPSNLPNLTLPVKKLSPKSAYVLTVTSPAQESTINESQDVAVSISLNPKLQVAAGHKISYKLDGQSILSQQTSVTFANVSRGTHQLQVSIVNSGGETISPVVTSTFYMKRYFKKPAAKPKSP